MYLQKLLLTSATSLASGMSIDHLVGRMLIYPDWDEGRFAAAQNLRICVSCEHSRKSARVTFK
jgi:hypothetical protein